VALGAIGNSYFDTATGEVAAPDFCSAISEIHRRPAFSPLRFYREIELEDKCVGDKLEAGSYRGTVITTTKRCGMTMFAQPPGVDEPQTC
jgi:hypothetical protein